MTENRHSFLTAVVIASVPLLCITIYFGAYFSLGRIMDGGNSRKIIVRVYPYQWQQDAFWVAGQTESFLRQRRVIVVDEAETRGPLY